MKIMPVVNRNIKRYINKNTIQGKFNRHVDQAGLFTVMMGGEFFLRAPHWQNYDYGITAILGLSIVENFKYAFKYLKDLQKIKTRAISIYKNSR